MENKFLGLTTTEWFAILGALAWLPTLIQLGSNYFSKPKITIVAGNKVEIGFNDSGPIINLDLAILAENKKVLITRIDLDLIHENNDSQRFSWIWFEEILSATDAPNTPIVRTKKTQNAIAIKIGADELIEKKIGFQNLAYKRKHSDALNKLTEDYVAYMENDKPLSDLKLQPSYRSISELFSNHFDWKFGKFKVEISAHGFNKVIASHKFSINLTGLDVKLLKLNIDTCNNVLEKAFINPDLEVTANWQWAYANINS